METFKRISDYPLYQISNAGALISDFKRSGGKPLKGTITSLGYVSYFICQIDESGKKVYKWNLAHRLVAEAFIPNPDNKPEVNHIDGNKENNNDWNLEWVTHAENIQKSFDTGQRKKITGADHWNTGGSHSDATKKLMREKKLGENHPKFKGWYVVNGEKYGSPSLAEAATGISASKVFRRCKAGKKGCSFLPINSLSSSKFQP